MSYRPPDAAIGAPVTAAIAHAAPKAVASSYCGRSYCQKNPDTIVIIALFAAAIAVVTMMFIHLNLPIQTKIMIGGGTAGALGLLTVMNYCLSSPRSQSTRPKAAATSSGTQDAAAPALTVDTIAAATKKHFERYQPQYAIPKHVFKTPTKARLADPKDEKGDSKMDYKHAFGSSRSAPPAPRAATLPRLFTPDEMLDKLFEGTHHAQKVRRAFDTCYYNPHTTLLRTHSNLIEIRTAIITQPMKANGLSVIRAPYSQQNQAVGYILKIEKFCAETNRGISCPIILFQTQGKWVCDVQDRDLMRLLYSLNEPKDPEGLEHFVQVHRDALDHPPPKDDNRFIVVQDERRSKEQRSLLDGRVLNSSGGNRDRDGFNIRFITRLRQITKLQVGLFTRIDITDPGQGTPRKPAQKKESVRHYRLAAY